MKWLEGRVLVSRRLLLLALTLLLCGGVLGVVRVQLRRESSRHAPDSPSTQPFDGGDSGTVQDVYDANTAWTALHYCKAAYCPVELLRNWSCGEACNVTGNFELYNSYDNTSYGTLGFSGVDQTQRSIVVAFRGSHNTENWIQDMSYWTIVYPDVRCGRTCYVHRGFYHAYASLRDGVLRDVAALRARHPDYALVITGHSLGGALALFCALDVRLTHDVPLKLYTFGEPRVGNVAFANWSSATLAPSTQRRLTHGRDVVPHLPPKSWGYVHVPNELWFNVSNATDLYQTCNDTTTREDLTCSDSVWMTTVVDHLYYLGVCTHCDCSAATVAAIARQRVSPRVQAVVMADYERDRLSRDMD